MPEVPLLNLKRRFCWQKDLGYLSDEKAKAALKSADEVSRILSGLISSLRDD